MIGKGKKQGDDGAKKQDFAKQNVGAKQVGDAERVAELTADLQRTRADFENYRKQVELQREQAMKTAKYGAILKFLPLLDDIERAIAAYPEELGALEKNFAKTLAGLGLTKIDSEAGAEFNPEIHNAMMVEGDGETEVVAETLQPGYLYEGDVLRPAMVKVLQK